MPQLRTRFVKLIPSDSEDSDLSSSESGSEGEGVVQDACSVLNEIITNSESDSDEVKEQPSFSHDQRKGRKKCVWKKGDISTKRKLLPFTGADALPEEILTLTTPLQYFQKLFPESLLQLIVWQSNLYAVQKHPEKPLKLTEGELEQFMGVCLWMSLVKAPNARKYWNARYKIECVSEVMGVNRWEEIKNHIHFHDNNDGEGRDRLQRIRPLINHLREALMTIPKEKALCVDEQIVPFKGRSIMKQYNPRKPHRWGYKVFVLSGVSGFCYDFEIYTGEQVKIGPSEIDCGASSNVVIRLCRTVPSMVGHKLYFDNYFSSIDLLVQLERRCIQSTGTVRLNRLPGLPGPSEKELKKSGRGAMNECLTNVDGADIACVRWYDNKMVNLVSTFTGAKPIVKVQRWSKAEHEYKEINCPTIVQEYNKNMGGVDLLDSLLGLYRIKIRSKKWYHRLFFHFLDMSIINSWLLYRRSLKQQNNDGNHLSLADFKSELAESKFVLLLVLSHNFINVLIIGLCKMRKSYGYKRTPGRPSLSSQLQAKRQRRRLQQCPTTDSRLDNISHWPQYTSFRMHCRVPSCKGQSRVRCTKCGVYLCLSNERNCFITYHTS
jgi:hypothetical protein